MDLGHALDQQHEKYQHACHDLVQHFTLENLLLLKIICFRSNNLTLTMTVTMTMTVTATVTMTMTMTVTIIMTVTMTVTFAVTLTSILHWKTYYF
jgi:hypothetical protein